MNLISSLLNRFRRKRFSPVEPHFTSEDQLFQMQFDERWVYSRSGNSFYYFFNESDDLKGGIQLSMIWNRPIAHQLTSMEALEQMVTQREGIQPIKTTVGEYHAYYIGANYASNNMDHHIWYVYIQQVQVRILYSIFEEEPIEIKKQWFERVARIIDTLTINQEQLLQTKFRS
jgi:hypothetical protein